MIVVIPGILRIAAIRFSPGRPVCSQYIDIKSRPHSLKEAARNLTEGERGLRDSGFEKMDFLSGHGIHFADKDTKGYGLPIFSVQASIKFSEAEESF